MNILKLMQSYFFKEQDRWVYWMVVALAIGAALFFKFPWHLDLYYGGIAAFILTGLLLVGKKYLPFKELLFPLLLFSYLIFLGYILTQINSALKQHEILHASIGPIAFFATIDKIEERPNGARFTFTQVNFAHKEIGQTYYHNNKLPFKVRLTARGAKNDVLKPGSRVRFFAKLMPLPSPSYPGGFDFQRFLYFKNIGATGYILGKVKKVKSRYKEKTDAMATIRKAIQKRVNETLPSKEAGIASALLTGEKTQIPDKIMLSIRNSGLAHLLAISGLHIGLIIGFIFFGSRALLAMIPCLALHLPIKSIAATIAMVGGSFYVVMIGAPVSAERALIMVLLFLGGVLLSREVITMRLVALAALFIILTLPHTIMEPSFQMSFGAVIALIAFYEHHKDQSWMIEASRLKKAGIYFVGVLMTTMIASLATLPFTIYHFHQFVTYGMLANLIAIPITSLLIMPAGLLALIFFQSHLLSAFFLKLMGYGISTILWSAESTSSLPGAHFLIPSIPDWGLALTIFGGLWLCLWKEKWRLFGFLPLIIGLTSPLITNNNPILFLAPHGGLLGIYTENSLYLTSKQTARFTRNSWAEMLGVPKGNIYNMKHPLSPIKCKGEKCSFQSYHFIFKAKDTFTLEKDTFTLESISLNKEIFQQNRPYMIYLTEKQIKLDSDIKRRGARPWIPNKGVI